MDSSWIAVLGDAAAFQMVRVGSDAADTECADERFAHLCGSFRVCDGAISLCCDPSATAEDVCVVWTAAKVLCEKLKEHEKENAGSSDFTAFMNRLWSLPDTRGN